MKVFIQHVVGSRNFTVDVASDDTVKDLKSRIKKITGLSSSEQGLVFNRSWLEDDHKLSDYRVEQHNTILLVPHGCLVEASYQRETNGAPPQEPAAVQEAQPAHATREIQQPIVTREVQPPAAQAATVQPLSSTIQQTESPSSKNRSSSGNRNSATRNSATRNSATRGSSANRNSATRNQRASLTRKDLKAMDEL